MEARIEIRKYSMTADNYQKLGAHWIFSKGGFVIALKEGECHGVKFECTPPQWGAWRAYFVQCGIKTSFMDKKAKLTASENLTTNPHCWTVPTEWPHEFDSEATVQGDHEAGDRFLRNYRPERLDMASAAQRAATVAAYRARIPFEAKRKYPDYTTSAKSAISPELEDWLVAEGHIPPSEASAA